MKILVATKEEYILARKYLPEYLEIVRTGVGASNVIRVLCTLPQGEDVINIGFCGSNLLPKGLVTAVAKTYRLKDESVQFEDYRNGLELSEEGYDCYTSNSFVTENQHGATPVVYDMELNYIAAFPINLLGSIKIVSDNLSVEQYEKSVVQSEQTQWSIVRYLVMEILKKQGQ